VLVAATACVSAFDDDPRCAAVMFDSLMAPYPRDDRYGCFPSVGEDTPTGPAGLGECGDDTQPGVVFTWGRFFAACPSCNEEPDDPFDGVFSPSDCRPLVCTTDEDCPSFWVNGPDGEPVRHDYECRNSLCQNSDTDLYPIDVISKDDAELLCLANVERAAEYEGEPWCPGVDDGEPCPLPLPDACMEPI
jgi:hypothetical protein